MSEALPASNAAPHHPIGLIVDRRPAAVAPDRLLPPHPRHPRVLIWAYLWGIAAAFAAIFAWFAALVTGHVPLGLHAFIASYAALLDARPLATRCCSREPYPGFSGRRRVPGRRAHRRRRDAEPADRLLPALCSRSRRSCSSTSSRP